MLQPGVPEEHTLHLVQLKVLIPSYSRFDLRHMKIIDSLLTQAHGNESCSPMMKASAVKYAGVACQVQYLRLRHVRGEALAVSM